ncbi:MAG: putative glycoside hydrolase, partial [Steroidobacteraceae bacterium]
RQESPSGSVVALKIGVGSSADWTGTQKGVFMISGRAIDLGSRASRGGTLEVRYRVDRVPERSVTMGLRCTESLCGTRKGATLDVTSAFRDGHPGDWRSLSVPLACFAATGADLGSVEVPFALATAGRFGLTISEVGIAHKTSTGAPCPGS